MPVSDQVRPVESSKPAPTSGFHAELHGIWGPPPALVQAGQFLSGVGEGFGQAVNEGAKAVAQAASNPGEALNKAVTETGKTIVGVLSATEKAGEYIGDHAARGDMKGVIHDAQNTSHAIDHVLTAGIEHLNKMNAHDLGKLVGHDVLPGAIVAVAAPELAGEGIALAASAASKIGTIAKEGAVIERVAGAYEAATSKFAAISEKMAGLNKKMEALTEQNGLKSVVKCSEQLPNGDGLPELGSRVEPTPEFIKAFEKAKETMSLKERHELRNVEIIPCGRVADELGAKYSRAAAAFKEATETEPAKIFIGEKHWHAGEWATNQDVTFRLHHEIGHARNVIVDPSCFSARPEFVAAFKADWANIPNHDPYKMYLRSLGGDRMTDETYADISAHAKNFIPHESNVFSNKMVARFPNVLELLRRAQW